MAAFTAGLKSRPFKTEVLPLQNVDLSRASLVEGADGGGLVVPDVEDGVELGDLEQVVDLLGEVEQLELAAGVFDGGECADQLSDAGAIDVADLGEVEQDVFGALVERVVNAVAQGDAAFAKGDAATEVEDGDSVYLADCYFHAHVMCLLMA